jgi:hypothetical protein
MSFPARNIQLVDVVKAKARDFDIVLSLTSGALLITDITAVWFTVKANEQDPDSAKLFQKTLGAGIALTGLSGNSVLGVVSLTNADTDLLEAGRTYFFDIQVDTMARGPEQAAQGRLACRQPATVANT